MWSGVCGVVCVCGVVWFLQLDVCVGGEVGFNKGERRKKERKKERKRERERERKKVSAWSYI